MARGGLRVLCLEKNHFIGGMASTTELIRGYRFELAGSIQFPVPNEIFEDLDLGSCPIYEPEVQSASIGERTSRRSSCIPIPSACSSTWARHWGSRPCSAWRRWRRGRRHPHEPLAASTSVARPARWTRCGPVPRTRRSVRPSAWRCSAACSMSWTAICRTAPNTHLCGACSASSPSTPPSAGRVAGKRVVPGVRAGVAGDGHHVEGARRSRDHGGPPARALFERHGGELRRHAKATRIVVDAGWSGVSSSVRARWQQLRWWFRISIRLQPSPS